MHVLYLLLRALKITEKKGNLTYECLSKHFPAWGFITSDNQNVDCAVEKHNQRIE